MGLDISAIKQQVKENSQEKQKRSTSNLFTKEIIFFKKKFTFAFKEKLYYELSTLIDSGLNLKSALDLYCSHLKGWQQEIFENIIQNIIKGDSLHIALKKTNLFSTYEFYTVKLGEEIGKLDKSFNELYTFYSRRIRLKKQIISAITYPMLVLITTILVVIFMLGFIVPMFIDVFNRFQSDLPALTKFVVSLSENYKTYLVVFFFLLSGIFGFYFLLRKKKWFINNTHKIILRIPIVGKLIKNSQLSRLFQTFNLLLGSGISLLPSIEICLQVIQYSPLQNSLTAIREKMIKGDSLYVSMESEIFFEKSDLILIKTGEEVNKLDEIFEKLYKQYQTKTEYQITMLNNFLEPALIVIVGGLVALILISMYLPLFQLSTGFF